MRETHLEKGPQKKETNGDTAPDILALAQLEKFMKNLQQSWRSLRSS